MVHAVAVATREYLLFIGGEAAEPASGELRDLTEPATGEPLARAALALIAYKRQLADGATR